jgi:hypothetical protein
MPFQPYEYAYVRSPPMRVTYTLTIEHRAGVPSMCKADLTLITPGEMLSAYAPVRINVAPSPSATFQIQNGVQIHVISLAKHLLLYSAATAIRTIYFQTIAFHVLPFSLHASGPRANLGSARCLCLRYRRIVQFVEGSAFLPYSRCAVRDLVHLASRVARLRSRSYAKRPITALVPASRNTI